MSLRGELKKRNQQTPADSEWKFEKLDIADRELIPMLHYEFARSALWMRRSYKALQTSPKCRKTRLSSPKFAITLSDIWPEFPKIPWLEIGEERRKRLCEIFGYDDKWEFVPIEAVVEFHNFSDLGFRDWLQDTNTTGFEGEQFTVMRIDWERASIKEIKSAIFQWIEKRGVALERAIEETYHEKKLHQGRTSTPKGGSHPKKQYKHALSQLGRLRLVSSAGDNWSESGVFNEEKIYKQAKLQVAELLIRLQDTWKEYGGVVDVFDIEAFNFWDKTSKLRKPFEVKQKQGKLEGPDAAIQSELLSFFDKQFVCP